MKVSGGMDRSKHILEYLWSWPNHCESSFSLYVKQGFDWCDVAFYLLIFMILWLGNAFIIFRESKTLTFQKIKWQMGSTMCVSFASLLQPAFKNIWFFRVMSTFLYEIGFLWDNWWTIVCSLGWLCIDPSLWTWGWWEYSKLWNITDAHCIKHSSNIKYLDHEDFHYYQPHFINIKQQLMSSWGEQKMKKMKHLLVRKECTGI